MRTIDNHIKYEDLYHNIISEMELMHKANIHKLKKGLNCIVIVPTIFLILLFLTKSSKVVFLVLWIVSMFIIAAYLIGVEYSDYKLQNRIREATHNEGREVTTLMTESIEQNRKALHNMLMSENSHLPIIGILNEIDKEEENSEEKVSVFNKILENEQVDQTSVAQTSDSFAERRNEIQEELISELEKIDENSEEKEQMIITNEIDDILSEYHNDFFTEEELKEFEVDKKI